MGRDDSGLAKRCALLARRSRYAFGGVFYFFHDRVGACLTHTGQPSQYGAGECAIGVHVSNARLDQGVDPTRDHVAFQDFGLDLHRSPELIEDVRRGAIQKYFDEYQRRRGAD